MHIILLLLAALASGYIGGSVAVSSARERELEHMRQGLGELLSELEYAAEEGCERLLQERLKLEQMVTPLQDKDLQPLPANAISIPLEPPHAKLTPTVGPRQHEPGEPPQLWGQVLQLAQEGKSRAEIAQRLDLGQGEVELILRIQADSHSTPLPRLNP
ncbi:MAG TPA: hypothetical protein VJ036_04970 [bacterium]|jgi:DNA-binding NarL/FixJ family response regulator|nr:hypothetical protein [bacterium]